MICTIAVIVGLAIVDDLTGPDFAIVLFYLVPVVATGWWQGSGAAIIVAVAAGLSWALVVFLGGDAHSVAIDVWKSVTRLVIFTAAGVLTARLRRNQDQLAELVRREADLARIDPMTRLPNWRGFEETLDQAIARCSRAGTALAVGCADLDNFKSVNDRYGHATGDAVLRTFGTDLREALRAGDAVARVGGDEFVLLTESTRLVEVGAVGERLSETVRKLAQTVPEAGLGISIGFVLIRSPGDWAGRASALVQRADAAMYQAKRAGKNRVVVTELLHREDDHVPNE